MTVSRPWFEANSHIISGRNHPGRGNSPRGNSPRGKGRGSERGGGGGSWTGRGGLGGGGGGGGGETTSINFFSISGGGKPTYSTTSYPSAVYNSGQDKTWVAWQGYSNSGNREVLVQSYDHTNEEWSALGRSMRIDLQDDDHGIPSIAIDADGYPHVALAPHQGNIKTASGDTANDLLDWTARTEFTGNFTYSHLLAVGSNLALLSRDDFRYCAAWVTTGLTDGAPTWGSKSRLVDTGTDTRFYIGTTLVVGSKVHIVGMFANSTNTERRHVYYLIWDTSTGSVFNHDESVETTSGNLPITLTDLNNDYRIVDMGSDNAWYPTLAINGDNEPHVAYVQGSSTPFDVKHTYKTSLGASSWQTPAVVDTIVEINGSPSLVPLSGSQVDLYYVDDPDSDWTRGGDIFKASWDGSNWGTPETVQEGDAAETDGGLNEPHAVLDATADARVLWSEAAPSDNISDTGAQRMWAHGASGYLKRSLQDPDGATTAILDAFGTTPSDTRKVVIDMLVSHLKSHGVWAKLDFLHVYAAHAEADALINWINPGTFDATLRGTTDPTFTVDGGFETDGNDQDIFSNYNPSTDAISFGRDDACFGFWAGEDVTGVGAAGFLDGAGGIGTFINPSSGAGNCSGRVNSDGTSVSSGVSGANGFFSINRSASNAVQLYRHGVEIDSNGTASDPIPDGTFRFGSTRDASYQAQTFRVGFAGGSLTARQHLALQVGLGIWTKHVTGSV